MLGVLSEKRTGPSITITAGPSQHSHSRVPVPHNHILLSHIQGSHNLEGQVHVIISHRNRVTQALASLFVTSGNALAISPRSGPVENTVSDSSSIVASSVRCSGKAIIGRFLATAVPSGYAILVSVLM
jgi:hypothetical protein